MRQANKNQIHALRRKLGIQLADFNVWVKRMFGVKITDIGNDKVGDVLSKLEESFGGGLDDDEETTELIPPAPEKPEEVKSEDVAEHQPEESDENQGRRLIDNKLLRGVPIICFYMSRIIDAFRMESIIEYMRRLHAADALIAYQFGFTPPQPATDKVRGYFFENAFKNNFRISPLFDKQHINRLGTVDLLITSDPSDKKNRQISAKARIGMQLYPVKHTHHLALPISQMNKYLVWNKDQKVKVKSAGVEGKRLLTTGSCHLTSLSYEAHKSHPTKSAAVYIPDPNKITTRGYLSSTSICDHLKRMGYDVHLVRWDGHQCYVPPGVKVVRDSLSKHCYRHWYPQVAIVAPGHPCEEAMAMRIPIVRIKTGQVITPELIKAAKIEDPPDGWVNLTSLEKTRRFICELTGLKFKEAENVTGR